MNERGVALPAVVFTLVAVLIGSATLFFTIFVDVHSTSNAGAGTDALYVAEAGAHRLWSSLGRAPDFAEALGWPDGEPPFGGLAWFPRPPRTYRVRVSAAESGGLRAVSEGTSHRGARARVEAIFRRESVFRAPAALVLDAGLASASVAGEITVASEAPGEQVPATGAESEETAALWSAASGGGETIAIVGDTGFRLSADALVEGADLTLAGPFGSDTWGGPESPKVVRLTGDARVTGEVRAYGIVVTDVPLHVAGWLMIDGLLLARGGLAIDGALVLNGAFWVSESLDVLASGSLEIDHDPAALAGAGDLRPTVLPREAILGAWRELW